MLTRDEILNGNMGNERITVMLLLDIRDLLIKQNKKRIIRKKQVK